MTILSYGGGRPHAFAYDLKAGDINEVRRLIDKYGIPVRGFTPEHNAYPYNYMIGTEAMRQDAVEYLKVCMDMAKEMGADFTLISAGHGGYNTPYEVMWERLIKTVKELVAHAEKLDHKLIVETMTPYETNIMRSVSEYERLFKEIDSPCLVGMCDTVAPFSQGESIMSYFKRIGDKLYHVHLVDGVTDSDTHIVPGEGQIPFPELIQELKEVNYQGTATIELVTNYINEPRMYTRRAINNVRALMKDAGF